MIGLGSGNGTIGIHSLLPAFFLAIGLIPVHTDTSLWSGTCDTAGHGTLGKEAQEPESLSLGIVGDGGEGALFLVWSAEDAT